MNCKRIFAALGRKAAGLLCLASLLLALPASAQIVTYVHTDALGSVVAKTDESGNVIERYNYEPYGAVVGGQVKDGPGYTGHVSDASTGLSYMQQRYMDPQLGVFLSVDPVTAYQKPVDQFNRYRYANGNPYRFTDPDGRSATLVAPWVIIVPVVIATTAYVVTTPEQRTDLGNKLDAKVRGLFRASEETDAEPVTVSDGSIVSDRDLGADGKRGSTGGPGAGKRFPTEPQDVRDSKQGVPCAYCGITTTNTPGQSNSRERDHIDPKSRGGNNSPENERDACRTCNRSKGAKNPDEWSGR